MLIKNLLCGGSGKQSDALPNLFCFITRNKEIGEYGRVIMDNSINEIIYDTKALEEIGFYIDKLKVAKRFKL